MVLLYAIRDLIAQASADNNPSVCEANGNRRPVRLFFVDDFLRNPNLLETLSNIESGMRVPIYTDKSHGYRN
jgi:hypothetical protein